MEVLLWPLIGRRLGTLSCTELFLHEVKLFLLDCFSALLQWCVHVPVLLKVSMVNEFRESFHNIRREKAPKALLKVSTCISGKSFYIDVKTVNTGRESFPVNIHIAGGTMASLQRPCSTFIVASLHSNECSIIAEQNSINFKHKICRIYIHVHIK